MYSKTTDFQLYQNDFELNRGSPSSYNIIDIKQLSTYSEFAKNISTQIKETSNEEDSQAYIKYFLKKIEESQETSNIQKNILDVFINILCGKKQKIYTSSFFDFFKIAKIFQIHKLIEKIKESCQSMYETNDIFDILDQNRKITAGEEHLFNEFIEVGGMREKLSLNIEACVNYSAFFINFPASSIFSIFKGSEYTIPSSCATEIYGFIKESIEDRLHFLPFVDAYELPPNKKDSLFNLLQKVEEKLKLSAEPKAGNEQNSQQFEFFTSQFKEMQSRIDTLQKEKEELQKEKEELQKEIHEINNQQQISASRRQSQQKLDENNESAGEEEETQRDQIEPPVKEAASGKNGASHQAGAAQSKDRDKKEENGSKKEKLESEDDVSKTYRGPPTKALKRGKEESSSNADAESLSKTHSDGKPAKKQKAKKEESSTDEESSSSKKDKNIKKAQKKPPSSAPAANAAKEKNKKLPSASDQHDDDYNYDYDNADDVDDDEYYDYDRYGDDYDGGDSYPKEKRRRDDEEKKQQDSCSHRSRNDDSDDDRHARNRQRGYSSGYGVPKHITEKNRRRIETFEENEKIVKKGKYKTQLYESVDIKDDLKFSIDNTKLVKKGDRLKFTKKTQTELYWIRQYELYSKIEVTEESTFTAAIKEKKKSKKVCVLNFASATQPGGGVLNGRNAQEESLSRQSTLYFSLVTQDAFYDYNKAHPNPFGTDYMIYSPNVLIIRNDYDSLIMRQKVSVITSVAVNNAEVQKKYGHTKSKDVYDTMKKRCRRILELCLSEGNDIIILGAFGCGVFKNSPKTISKIFKELLIDEKYACYFKKIVFAIKRKPNESRELIDSFKTALTY